MSNPNPRPARRRIAGERRPARVATHPLPEAAPEPAPEQAPDDRPAAVAAPARPEPVEEPTADPAVAPGTEPSAAPAEGPTGPSWLVVAVLGAVALALLATAAVLGLGVWDIRQVRQEDQVAEAGRQAPAQAERAAAAILSYGYKTLDEDQQAAEKYLTASYRKDYADTFDRLVRPNATKLKANVEAQVRGSGVTHADPDRVNVLLYVNQTTKSTAHAGEPQVALNRVQLAMVRQGDDWLVDDITSY